MTKKRSSKKTPKPQPVKKPIRKLILPQAPATFQAFITHYGDMFNLTELERRCELPTGTLRHIRTGSRACTWEQYESVRKGVLPAMMELALIMQNYDRRILNVDISF
jgi:hypothetical protein